MHEIFFGLLGFIFRLISWFVIEIIAQFFFDYLPKKFFGYSFYEKDVELIEKRITILKKEEWFKPYEMYLLEISQRKSIQRLILKANMHEIISIVEKRNEFLTELDRRLFDLNPNGSRNRKTSLD
ncbi:MULTISPECIES: hypothetical protein [Bacillaceae]|uniref:Uncharacterized protein n=1 Tax=Gottfriedia luciferensis TaxID=178774 RepID=A0ABX2ZVA8_9BACI|nr:MULTISPECIES: hypothetical protein [Bacillaceae]ODG93493.1 hypothetical protein BED47_04215 [Gottfriedia luciferensis]PGZ93409.1 hypothetical protein COE53_06830 [Bacillus sp. AFS029533]SFC44686.1 hypothetical protein SAMN02799633_00826 [Bacillus sp. UNCCL81]